MLSVGGTSKYLECADCKSSFSSASLLLRHFAEHIERNFEELHSNHASPNTTPHKRSKVSRLQEEKKKRNESILETVLRQSVVQNVMSSKTPSFQDVTHNSNTSSSDSFSKSAESHVNSDTDNVKDDTLPTPNDMVIEIGQRAKEKKKFCSETALIKFDLQKRLENCVSRLALKHGSSESNLSDRNNSLPQCSSKLKESDTMTCANSPARPFANKNGEVDDFNPLKYCIVTLDENEGELEVHDKNLENGFKPQNIIPRPSKGASNRKQQMPKRVHRPQEGSAISQVLRTADSVTVTDEKVCQKTPTVKKKYQCQVCSKSFGWSTDLKRHILTHTGERPFKCQMCDATFTRNFLLQKHESRVHSLAILDKCSQEERKDTSNAQGDKHEVQETEVVKKSPSGKSQPFMFWTNNSVLLKDNVENSVNLRLGKTQEMCDKYSTKKRKLPCDGSASFDLFPQKVFNIL